jgi:hypothetical protein
MSLGDLDELVQSCRNEEGKAYIAEAVSCYRAGAFRACIVSTWIAVVFDLIAKVRELALSGDAEAQKITTDLSTWQPLIELGDMAMIKKSLELERTIVDITNEKFGFFDGLQLIDLHRLRDDRNRCAHPTFQGSDQPYAPSSELARAHLVHAVRHVLSQPPVQGKAAVEHIMRSVTSSYFPQDNEAAKTQLRLGGLDRPKDSLVRAVVDQLIFGVLEGGADLKARPQTAAALKAVYDLHPGQAEPRIKRALNVICRRLSDVELPLIFALYHYLPQTWNFLELDNKQKFNELVKQLPDNRAAAVLPWALKIDGLHAEAETRIKKLGPREIGQVLKASQNPILVSRAVDLYCSSKNWGEANSTYEQAIEPIIDKLTQDQLRRIIAASQAEGADLNGANSFSGFARYIYEQERLPKPEILKLLTDNGMKNIADRIQ